MLVADAAGARRVVRRVGAAGTRPSPTDRLGRAARNAGVRGSAAGAQYGQCAGAATGRCAR